MARPELEFTEEQRRSVQALAGFGVPQDDISLVVGISPHTLRKHFRHELDVGAAKANAAVAQTLFTMATVDKNTAAAIFWLKARAGWREKHEIEVNGTVDVRRLDDGQLEQALRAELASYLGRHITGDDQPPVSGLLN